jgi:hypothetical protein
MKTFYVYSLEVPSRDRALAFIDDPVRFAQHAYDPKTMKYTGVAVGAESVEEAKKVYDNPSLGPYNMVDEPEATANPTAQKDVAEVFQGIAIDLAQKLFTKSAEDVHIYMSRLADAMYAKSRHKILTPQDIYAQLRHNLVQYFAELPYNERKPTDRPGDNPPGINA